MKHFKPITKPHPFLYKDMQVNGDLKTIDANQLHLFTINGKHFMFANDSSLLFEVSKDAFEFINGLQKNHSTMIDHSILYEWELMSQHNLFLLPPNKEAEEKKTVDTININICQCCNLSCKYCFADDGVYGGEPKYMDRTLLECIIKKFVSGIMKSGNNGNIVLFGGEPLLAYDLICTAVELVKKLTAGISQQVAIDIFTNATLINKEFIRFLTKNTNVRLLISLDGPPSINNRFRTSPSFGVAERVGQVIQELSKCISISRIILRCTISDTEINLVERIEYFVSLGIESIVMDAAFCIGYNNIPRHEEILRSITSQLPDIANYLIRHPNIQVNLISEMTARLLSPDINRGYRTSQCPAGTKYLAIDSDGYVFPCHFFVGDSDHKITHIANGFVQNDISEMYGLKINEYFKCKNCSYSSLCEGFCPNKFRALGSHFDEWANVYCDFVNARITILYIL
ncbi:MAG: SPASM domain-containing protein [Clostridiales bacterium]|nr:SPASM domain-containing protein [Clostridiales bacterium]